MALKVLFRDPPTTSTGESHWIGGSFVILQLSQRAQSSAAFLSLEMVCTIALLLCVLKKWLQALHQQCPVDCGICSVVRHMTSKQMVLGCKFNNQLTILKSFAKTLVQIANLRIDILQKPSQFHVVWWSHEPPIQGSSSFNLVVIVMVTLLQPCVFWKIHDQVW